MTRNRRDFDALANYLSSQGRHVFCPDIVGRGDSDYLKNPLHYTYEQYIADMNVMIARTHAKEKLDWIGSSMGGLIGMILAALPRNPIRRLVINDIGPQIPSAAIGQRGIGADLVENILQRCRFCRSCRFTVLHGGLTSLDGL